MDKLVALRVLQAIHDSGSFVAAANRLGMSTAMVSKHVTALEQTLGTRLIQRTTRRLTFTGPGQDYLQRTAQALAQLDEADAAAMQQSIVARGSLRLAAPLSFGMRYLGDWLATLHHDHSQLQVELELSDRQIDLLEDGIDLALRISTVPLSGGLIARPLASLPMAVAAAPAYLARHGTPLTPHDLSRHACLRYQQGGQPQVWAFGHGEERQAIEVSGPLVSNNGDVLVAAAEAGMGIVYQPAFLLAPAMAAGRLQALFSAHTLLTAELYALYPARRYLPMKVRVLIELLQAQAAQLAVPGHLSQWS